MSKNEKPKILVITPCVTRYAGGIFDAVRDLFCNPILLPHVKELLSYLPKHNEEKDDILTWKNIPMSLYKGGPLLYSQSLRNKALTSSADILDIEGIWRYPHLFMATWRKHTTKPIVCSPHGMLDPYIICKQGKLKRIISNIFFQKALNSVTCWRALSKDEMADIRAYGQKEPIAIIPNGIHLPKELKRVKPEDGKKHLLFLGRLHPKKGIDILIEAIAILHQKYPVMLEEWHIDIVGWNHENTEKALIRMIKNYQLQSIITMHGGLFGTEKELKYAQASAFILPSHGEGLPMTILEAWAWKLPVIMTPECRIPEGFENNAAIKINNNTEGVVRGLIKLFQMSNEERLAMGVRGRQLVEKQFTWEASAKKMMALYNWLCGHQEKPHFVHKIREVEQ